MSEPYCTGGNVVLARMSIRWNTVLASPAPVLVKAAVVSPVGNLPTKRSAMLSDYLIQTQKHTAPQSAKILGVPSISTALVRFLYVS